MAQISPNVSSGPYTADGSQVAFPFSFSIVDARQILVEVDGASLSTLVGYTVAFGDTSGTVTFGTAPALGAQVFFVSNPDYTQTSHFATQGAYNLDAVNQINRRAAVRDLVLKADILRSLKAGIGTVLPNLPPLADGEGRVIGIAGGQFVYAPNNAVAVAGDVAAAQAAATTAAAAATQTGLDVVATTTAISLLPSRYSKIENTVRTATTTLTADPDLRVPLPANALMTIKGEIYYTTTAAGDFKWRHTGPASPTSVTVDRRAVAPGASADSAIGIDAAFSTADISVDGAAGSGVIKFDARIQNGANAGYFGISWAQNTSDAGNTIALAGSYLEAATLAVPLVFTFGDAAVAKLGEWQTFYGGRAAGLGEQDISSWVEFIATGYKLTAVMYGNGNNCTLTLDGVPQVLTPPAGWSTVTLYDGLPDVARRVKISGAVGTSNACAFDAAATFSLSSHAVPTVSRPTDISNYWFLGSAPFATYGALDTTPAFGGGFGTPNHSYTWHGDGFEMRFRSTTDKIQIFSYGYGTEQYVVLQDGVAIADVAIPADNIWDIRTLATGLPLVAHEYEVFQRVALSTSTNLAVLAATIEPVAHPVLSLDAYYGDSIVVAGVLTDIRQFDGYIVAKAGTRASRRVGTGGAKASTFGRDNTALVTGLAQTPVKVFECFGVNDMQAAVNLATFQADVQTMLVNLRAGLPSAKIYCRGILPVASSVSNSALRGAYNSAKAAAVAAIGDTNIVYVNTDGWINPTTDTYDGLHPNATGYGKVGAAQLLVM